MPTVSAYFISSSEEYCSLRLRHGGTPGGRGAGRAAVGPPGGLPAGAAGAGGGGAAGGHRGRRVAEADRGRSAGGGPQGPGACARRLGLLRSFTQEK